MKILTFDSKVNLAIFISLFFIMILGCQPEKGNFVVLPSQGVEIITSEIDNDTAQIKEGELIVKVNGKWSAAVLFQVDIRNSGSKEVLLDFGEMTLVNGEREVATVGDITENQANNLIYIRNARVDGKDNVEKAPKIKINPKENRQFSMVFSKPFGSVKDDETKRLLYFTIPVLTEDDSELRRELKVVFKATK